MQETLKVFTYLSGLVESQIFIDDNSFLLICFLQFVRIEVLYDIFRVTDKLLSLKGLINLNQVKKNLDCSYHDLKY